MKNNPISARSTEAGRQAGRRRRHVALCMKDWQQQQQQQQQLQQDIVLRATVLLWCLSLLWCLAGLQLRVVPFSVQTPNAVRPAACVAGASGTPSAARSREGGGRGDSGCAWVCCDDEEVIDRSADGKYIPHRCTHHRTARHRTAPHHTVLYCSSHRLLT